MKTSRAVARSAFLLCSLAASVAVVMLTHRFGTADLEEGVVYVYFPSLCDTPGEYDACHEIPGSGRPSFASMEACAAHANRELRRQNNPKMIANCVWEREG